MIIGKHKVLGLMLSRSMSLSELSEKSGLTKPTVLHHLENLQEQKIVKQGEFSKDYSVNIDKELKTEILKILRKGITIEDLAEQLKNIKLFLNKKALMEKLAKDPDLLDTLNDLLEVLFLEGLVNTTKIGRGGLNNYGDYSKYDELWELTWLGCKELNICPVCKKPFSEEDKFVVSHNFQIDGFVREFQSVLIHSRCICRLEEDHFIETTTEPLTLADVCDFCGLSLSENNLVQQLSYSKSFGKKGFDLLYDLLTKKEIDALTAWRRLGLGKQFNERYGIDPPDNVFAGDLIKKHEFSYVITKELAEKMLKQKDNPKIKKLDFGKDGKIGNLDIFYEKGKHSIYLMHEPQLSKVDELYDLIEEGAQIANLEPEQRSIRVRELFSDWINFEKNRREKIEKVIESLFGDDQSRVYRKLEASYPDVGFTRVSNRYGTDMIVSSQDYSFVRKEGDKRYHSNCYEKMKEVENPNVVNPNKKIPGSKALWQQ